MTDRPDARWRRSIGSRDITDWRSRSGRRLVEAARRSRERLGRRRSVAAAVAAGAGVALAATWASTLLYDAVADRDGISRLDVPALRLAMRLRGPAADAAAAVIAEVFGPIGMPILTVGAGAGLAARQGTVEPLAVVLVAGAGSLAMTLGGKGVVDRHRPRRRDAIPPYETSPSFPSGHTLNATAIGGVVAYLLMLDQRRRTPQVLTVAAAAGTALTVGGSRVLLGAHWLTDVMTGWTLGLGWVAAIVTVHRLQRTLDRPGAEPV